ncbi:MAG: LamB/YcsF family protein, partial [Deltaproteobacteria bacterium]|nr:LamB/YcsF family protein [Deltaproteobacteria bacterium]
DVIYQVGALKGFLSLYGMPLQHVKLHGALYNDLVNKADIALQIVRTVGKTFDNPIFLTLATTKATALKKKGKEEGLRIALEAFPDRMYTDAGELLSREQAGAVLKDPDLIAQRAVKMIKERGIESIHGRWLDLDIDTLCIHGDNPESIEAAKKIVAACAKEKFQIRPLGEFI